MFASKRSLFNSANGSVKAWLAGVTLVALLVGTVALPAVAEKCAAPVAAPSSTSGPITPESDSEAADKLAAEDGGRRTRR